MFFIVTICKNELKLIVWCVNFSLKSKTLLPLWKSKCLAYIITVVAGQILLKECVTHLYKSLISNGIFYFLATVTVLLKIYLLKVYF